jgi:hypothetical protein
LQLRFILRDFVFSFCGVDLRITIPSITPHHIMM